MTNDTKYRKMLKSMYKPHGYDRNRLYVYTDGIKYEANPCWYCGDAATSEDHVYPMIATLELLAIGERPPPTLMVYVPCCNECNNLLGDKIFSTLTKRKRYVKGRLKRRYSKILAIPAWDKGELQEVDARLREYVHLGLNQRNHLLKRLEW